MIELVLLSLIILLQLIDAVSTWNILKLGGRELNPLQKWLMKLIGTTPSLIVSKCTLVGGCSVAAWYASSEPMLKVLLYFLTVIFGYVCINNLQVWSFLKPKQ